MPGVRNQILLPRSPPVYPPPADTTQIEMPAGTRQLDSNGWSPAAVTWEQTPATPADISILRAAHDKHLRTLSHDELARLCEEELGLGQPTGHESIANTDPLFNRRYKADGVVFDPGMVRRCLVLVRICRLWDPAMGVVQSQLLIYTFALAEAGLAMKYLREQVEALKDRELFEALPKLSRGTGDGLDGAGSSGKVVGGGGVAGPSAADAVDIAKLLEECGALPVSMEASSPSNSTARGRI